MKKNRYDHKIAGKILLGFFIGMIYIGIVCSPVCADISGSEENQTNIQLTLQKCLGGSNSDQGYEVISSIDRSYLVAGYTRSKDGDVSGNHGSSDVWAVKMDPSGTIQWQKCFGGSNSDYAYSATQTGDGGYLTGGLTFSNDGDVSGKHGDADLWVVKMDSGGTLQWQKCLGGSSTDWAESIIQTKDGGYLAGGTTYSNDGDVSGNHGSSDGWIVKLDNSGDLQWQKCLGGSSGDYFYSVIQTTDGGYLAGGYTYSNDGNVSGNHGQADYWMVKLNADGNQEWQKCLGGSDNDIAESIIQTTDGEYLIGGMSSSNDNDVSGNHGNNDYWVAKLDSSGSLQWQKCLGGSSGDWAESVIQTTDGGYLVGGVTFSEDGDISGYQGNGDYWIVKLDTEGNLQWQKCLGGTKYDHLFSLTQATDKQYLAVGYTNSDDGDVTRYHGNNDFWMVRITVHHPVSAISDPWTILYPFGNKSYIEGTNATYITQSKPGATLENVTVDTSKVGPANNWTFTTIMENHTISTSGIPTPGQVHAFFSMNTTWGQAPLTVAFTNESLGSPNWYYWNFGDGTTSSVRDPVHTYTIPGVYSISLKASNDYTAGITTCNNAVTVTEGPIPSPTPTQVPADLSVAFSADRTFGSAPMEVTFTDQSTGNPVSWRWDLGDGNTSTTQNVTHTYYEKGTYSVTLLTKNSISSGQLEKKGYISVK